jgi:hypothetical protein
MWGKRKKHNDFKYEICTNLEINVRVLELYPLVHQKQETTNNNIALSFTKALLIERNKIKVNWAHFVEHVGLWEQKFIRLDL